MGKFSKGKRVYIVINKKQTSQLSENYKKVHNPTLKQLFASLHGYLGEQELALSIALLKELHGELDHTRGIYAAYSS